jgi:hypothetical protein
MQSLVRSRRSQLTPRARFVVSALSECWGSCPIPTLAACAASTICRVARLRMRAFVDARHSKSARLRRAPGCGEWGAPPPPHLCLSRQAPLLSPRPARSASEGRPRGLSLLASFVMRTERNDVGAIRFAGSAQSVVGRIRRQRLRRCTGLGVRPRPASRSLPVFCCGPRYAAIWRARGSRHLTTSRDPRDEALATSRPLAVGQRPPRVSDDRCDWEADDSASYGSAGYCVSRTSFVDRAVCLEAAKRQYRAPTGSELGRGRLESQMVDASRRPTTAHRAGVPGMTDMRGAVLDNVGINVAQTGSLSGANIVKGGTRGRGARRRARRSYSGVPDRESPAPWCARGEHIRERARRRSERTSKRPCRRSCGLSGRISLSQ